MPTDAQPFDVEGALSKIDGAAKDAGSRADDADTHKRLSGLEERVASIEPLLEQLQANSQLSQNLAEYVSDLRAEQVFFNRARYGVGCVAFFVIIGLIALLSASIFCDLSPLLQAPPLAVVTYVIGTVSGIAIILNSFVKGIFRSTAERHADGFLPPALEKAVELMSKVNGK